LICYNRIVLKRIFSLALFVLFAALPLAVSAALYFEFSPDFRESFLIATATTVEQVFLPLNDHLNGIDFWVSNANTPATVTFTLLSPSGTALTSRTETIGAIPDDDMGQRHTILFPVQVTTTPDAAYRVRIGTSSSTLRLYWATVNRLLAHNAPPPSAYSSGTARIDGSDQAKSFLYALHETTEASPPVISGLGIQQPLIGQARIVFNASEPVDMRLRFGPQGQALTGLVDFTGAYQSCVAGIQECAIPFAVTPGTSYEYELIVRDVWGNESSATGTFISNGTPPSGNTPTPTATPTPTNSPAPTPPPADTIAPIITNLRAVYTTPTSADIAWTTNEAANSLVVVQSMPFLINAGGGSDATLELEHLISIEGLESDTSFQARVTSSDGSGNTSIAVLTFQTSSAGGVPSGNPTPTPSPSTLSPAPPTPTVSVGPGGDGEQTAQWSAPASGAPTDGYRIDIIGADGKLIRTIRTASTSANLGDIPEGATIVVYADNGGIYEKVGTPGKARRISWIERLTILAPWILAGIGGAIGVIIGVMRYRARRKAPSQPIASAQPYPPAVP
jgi:hypothetical protein